MNRNKLHLIGFALSIIGLVLLSWLPKLTAAGRDIQTFQGSGQNRGKPVFNVDEWGGTRIGTTGVSQPDIGFLAHHEVMILYPSSRSFFINPDVAVTTLGNTALASGATTYSAGFTASSMTQMTQSQLFQPRTIEILSGNATAFVTIKGTDSFNRAVTETLQVSSSAVTQTRTCWIGISSVTFNYTITAYNSALYGSSALFSLGTSSGYGMPFQVSFASDVYRVTFKNIIASSITAGTSLFAYETIPTIISSATVSPTINPSVIYVSSQAFPGGNLNGFGTSTTTIHMELWAIERKTPYAP